MAAVQRWGNSLAVRIPARLAESLAMREGTQVDLECKAGAIVMRPRSRPRHRLSQLLRGCTKATRHRETDFGPDVGAEVVD
jgi:antitoxin MazE